MTTPYRDQGAPTQSLVFFRGGSRVVFLENAPSVLALYTDESYCKVSPSPWCLRDDQGQAGRNIIFTKGFIVMVLARRTDAHALTFISQPADDTVLEAGFRRLAGHVAQPGELLPYHFLYS